jgi:hypothetical protein
MTTQPQNTNNSALPVPVSYTVNLGAHSLTIDQHGATLASHVQPECVIALDGDEMYCLCTTLQHWFAEQRTLPVDEAPLPPILSDAEALAWHEARQQAQ